MELSTSNPPARSQTKENAFDESALADAVFADPVGYLASHGISSRLVSVTGVPIPKAA